MAAGASSRDVYRFALARYNTNGTLDTTFSADGKVTTNFSASVDEAHAVAIQADGKIVAAGHSNGERNGTFALARYTAHGTLDPTFGGDGKVTTDFTPLFDVVFGVGIQDDGKSSRLESPGCSALPSRLPWHGIGKPRLIGAVAHARRGQHAAVRGRPAAETRAGEVAASETGHARDLPRAVLSQRTSAHPSRSNSYRMWPSLTMRLPPSRTGPGGDVVLVRQDPDQAASPFPPRAASARRASPHRLRVAGTAR